MHIHLLASFIFICTYSALFPLLEGKSIVKRQSDATSKPALNIDTATIIPTEIDETAQDESNKGTNKPIEIPPAKDNAKKADIKKQSTEEGGTGHPFIDRSNDESKKTGSKVLPKTNGEEGGTSHPLKDQGNVQSKKTGSEDLPKTNGSATDDKEPTLPKQPEPARTVTKPAGTGFHGLSFFVGILFSVGVMIVSYGCYRHYKKRTSSNTSLLSREDYATF